MYVSIWILGVDLYWNIAGQIGVLSDKMYVFVLMECSDTLQFRGHGKLMCLA